MPQEYPPPFNHTDFTDAVVAPDQLPILKVLAIRSPGNRTVRNVAGLPIVSLDALKVTSNRTGKSSKTSFKDDPGVAVRSDSKEKRFHFAPEVEMLQVHWEVTGAKHVTRVRLEVYRRGDVNPLFTKRLTYQAGHFPAKGSTTFDGSLHPIAVGGQHYTEAHDSDFLRAEFPFAVLTVEHSPYKLKFVIENPNGALCRFVPARWIYLDVLLDDLKLSWGPKELLAASPHLPTNGAHLVERDHQVYDAVTDVNDAENLSGALPQPGQRKKVPLQAHVFYRAEAELVDNSNYEEFFAVWGEGANLPIVLTPGVLRSDGKRVTGAQAKAALGAQKFVWEWEDAAVDLPAEIYEYLPSFGGLDPGSLATAQANARGFIHDAMDFDQAATTPPGRNCHVERGGKRGPNAPAVFPVQGGGGAFPFVVTNPALGNWCAVSALATTGPHVGTTGVIFRPSIQPGDAFKLRVAPVFDGMVDPTGTWAAFHGEMDDLPDEICAKLGAFEVWKTLKHTVLSAVPTGIQAPQLASYKRRLAGFYVDVKNAQQPLNTYTAALATMYNGAHAQHGVLEVPARLALANAAAHVDLTRGVYFTSWAVWKQALIAHHGNAAAAAGWASAYVHLTRDFWRNQYDQVPFAEPWPANVVNAANPVLGDTSVAVQVTGGHLNAPPTVKSINVPNVGAVRAALKTEMVYFFRDARGQFRTGVDAPLAVTVTAQPGDFVAAGDAVTQAISDANDEVCESVYNNALSTAWGFRVMDLVLNGLLGTEDGIITVQFSKPSQLNTGPAAKAYFAPATRASIFIFMLKDNEMEGTMCHETGHAMFVNHQYYEQPANDPRELHELNTGLGCTMSTPSRQRNFCGFCMLRLRSWSIYKLDAARAREAIVPVPHPVVPNMHTRTLDKTSANNRR